jgi:hypothetical protein
MKKLISLFLLFTVPVLAQPSTWSDSFKPFSVIVGNGNNTFHTTPVNAGDTNKILRNNGLADPTWVTASSLGAIADPVTPAHGGLGTTTLTSHGVVIGQGTSTAHVTVAGTAGQIFTSGGASADPGYITLLPIANGGTNSGTASGALNNLVPDTTGKTGYLLRVKAGGGFEWVSP